MHIRKHLQLLLCLSLLVTAAPSLATTVTYIMDQSNTLADDVDYLSVTLSDDTAGQLDFWVDTLPVMGDIAGDNYGIQSFAFNYSELLPADSVQDSDFILTDGWRTQYDKGMSEAGMFDVRLMGAGNSRQDTLHFSIIGLSLDDVVADFAAHVRLVSPAVIPVPAAAWLFGSGLIGLMGVARRRRA
jgi:hypothetical protein